MPIYKRSLIGVAPNQFHRAPNDGGERQNDADGGADENSFVVTFEDEGEDERHDAQREGGSSENPRPIPPQTVKIKIESGCRSTYQGYHKLRKKKQKQNKNKNRNNKANT